jgi:hypothetical protein
LIGHASEFNVQMGFILIIGIPEDSQRAKLRVMPNQTIKSLPEVFAHKFCGISLLLAAVRPTTPCLTRAADAASHQMDATRNSLPLVS